MKTSAGITVKEPSLFRQYEKRGMIYEKIIKRSLSLFLSLILTFSICQFAFAEEAQEETKAENAAGFTDEDFLVTKGRNIYNQKDEKIQL